MKRTLTLLVLVSLLLLAGIHSISAQSGNIWQASFFNNTTLSGGAVVSYSVSVVDFNWGSGSPYAGVAADNFSARFLTTAYFNPGFYRFSVTADDDVRLYVNGQLYLNTFGTGQAGKTFTVDVAMPQGYSNIQLDYAEYGGFAYVSATWGYVKPSTVAPTPVPPNPQPPAQSASSVNTQYGNYTPCIQQRIHQSNCFRSDGQWNSPNLGSIQMEPQIAIWGNCTPGQELRQVVRAGESARRTQCSKTAAGWFVP